MNFQDHPQFVDIADIKKEGLEKQISYNYVDMSMDPEIGSTAEDDGDFDEMVAEHTKIDYGPTEIVSEVINSNNQVFIPNNEVIGENKLNCGWTVDATKALIAYYKEYRDGVGSSKIRNMKRLWELVSAQIQAQGFSYTAANCENKFRVLERNFKKYVSTENKHGRFKRYFEYYEETKDIFGRKWSPYANPIFGGSQSQQSTSSSPKTLHTSTLPSFSRNSSQPSTSRAQTAQTRVLLTLPSSQVHKLPPPAILTPITRPATPPMAPIINPSSPESSPEPEAQKPQKTSFVKVLQKIRSNNSRYKKEKIAYLRHKAKYYEEKNRKMDDLLVEIKTLSHAVIRLCNTLTKQ